MLYQSFLYNFKRSMSQKNILTPPLKLRKDFQLQKVMHYGCIDQDLQIFPFRDGTVKAFNKDNSILWQQTVSDEISELDRYEGSIIYHNDIVYVFFEDYVCTINYETGNIINKYKTTITHMLWHCVMYEDCIFSLNYENDDIDNIVFASIDKKFNNYLWKRELNNGYYSQGIALHNDTAIINDIDDQICAVNVVTGTDTWRRSLKDILREAGTTDWDMDCRTTRNVIIYKDLLVLPIFEHHFACLDLKDGTTKWAHKLDVRVTSDSAVYPDDRLYVLGNGLLYVIDIPTGEIVTRKNFEAEWDELQVYTPCMPAISDTTIFTADPMEGMLFAIDKESLEITWHHRVRKGLSSAYGPIIVGDRLYAMGYSDELYVFEEKRKKKQVGTY